MVTEPPSKRAKTDGEAATERPSPSPNGEGANGGGLKSGGPSDDALLDPISPDALRRSDELAASYRDARPYPHGLIRGFCREGFLEDILTELKHNSKVKFKETDLFRVYQSIDLGNLKDDSELAAKIPALMKLKRAIYSPEYRSFVEKLAGLEPGTLTDEVDCAANCHAKGCHLLCHDDVIGTRKVSYIIYLTDPSPTWTDEDGGRLELYDAVPDGDGDATRRVPGALPARTILPEFNSMAFFAVEPGVSFHSVQEVFGDRPRLSLQGWYHAGESPGRMEDATLRRLKSTGRGEDTEGTFEPLAGGEEGESGGATDDGRADLSREDRDFLGGYINPAYLTDESMGEIQTRFEEESSIKLRHFLVDELNARITKSCKKMDDRDRVGRDRPSLDYKVGTDENWKAVGPAHKQRFLEYEATVGNDKPVGGKASADDGDDDAGGHLHGLRTTLFRSAAFGRWLGRVSSLGCPLGERGRVRRFRPGLDYTVAHYGVLTTDPVLDATLCFCAGDGEPCAFDDDTDELVGSDDDAVWESGDVGGFECYIAADEGGEDGGPDAEYDDEDDTKLLSVQASNNTLSLVYRDPGTMRFVKYVGAGAPSSRWDVALEYNVEADDDEAEGEEEEENGDECWTEPMRG